MHRTVDAKQRQRVSKLDCGSAGARRKKGQKKKEKEKLGESSRENRLERPEREGWVAAHLGIVWRHQKEKKKRGVYGCAG